MKSFLNKAMLTLVVFGLAIVSSFAMETDPPTEPVKTTHETEVVEEVQPSLIGYGYYDFTLDECIAIEDVLPPLECHPDNFGIICTGDVNGTPQDLYFMSRATPTSPWICGDPLRKP